MFQLLFARPAKKTRRRPRLAEVPTPRYPPFMEGLPAVPVQDLLDSQAELLRRLRLAVDCTKTQYAAVYEPLIRRYATFVHLLPASESNHHRGSGGLLRHGLEVALWATESADQVMFARRELPARRRDLEPRWRCAVFIAALYHDVGKPVSDLRVTTEGGEHEWSGHTESLAAWLERMDTDYYFLHWRKNRYRDHETLTPVILHSLIPPCAHDYLAMGGAGLYQKMIAAVSARDFATQEQEHNPVFKLVRDADCASTRKDIGDPVAAGMPGALGLPPERFIMDAMRRLVREGEWRFNKPGSRLWVMENTVFIVWPAGAEDIVRALGRERLPGIPREPQSLAEILIERGWATPCERPDGASQWWPIQPRSIRDKNPGVILHALRLEPAARLFDEMPASVRGIVGVELDQVHEPAAPAEGRTPGQAQSDAQSQTAPADTASNANDAVAPASSVPSAAAHSESAGHAATATPDTPQPSAATADARQARASAGQRAAARPAPPFPAAQPATAGDAADQAEQAQRWFAAAGHAGAIVAALAADFADGLKHWGKDAVRQAGGTVAIRHPESWAGSGVAGKDILPLLLAAGWVEIDPFAPMRRVREVEDFDAGKGGGKRAALVLTHAASARFLAIAGAAARANAARKEAAPAKAPPAKAVSAKAAPASPALGHEQVAGLLRAAASDDPDLPHRRVGAQLLIDPDAAAAVLTRQAHLSRNAARKLIAQLPRDAGGKAVVIGAPGAAK